jgi:hypothetical protein
MYNLRDSETSDKIDTKWCSMKENIYDFLTLRNNHCAFNWVSLRKKKDYIDFHITCLRKVGRYLMLWVWISIRVRCTTLCDKFCQWLATGRWFSPGPPISSTNKTYCHDIAEILLNVVLNTIKQTNKPKG